MSLEPVRAEQPLERIIEHEHASVRTLSRDKPVEVVFVRDPGAKPSLLGWWIVGGIATSAAVIAAFVARHR